MTYSASELIAWFKEYGWLPFTEAADGRFFFIVNHLGNAPIFMPVRDDHRHAMREWLRQTDPEDISARTLSAMDYFKRRMEMMGDCITIRRKMLAEASSK